MAWWICVPKTRHAEDLFGSVGRGDACWCTDKKSVAIFRSKSVLNFDAYFPVVSLFAKGILVREFVAKKRENRKTRVNKQIFRTLL
jgi:hypothetical protein